MKRKIIVIITIILSVFLLVVAVGLIGLGYMSHKGLGATEGRCLITSKGSYMLIDENGSPIVMHNIREKTDLFKGLSTGDEIIVIHGPVRESYPGGTDAYYCKKLSDGEFEDIPKGTLESLSEFNWIESPYKGEKVECFGEDFRFSLVIPEGWNYRYGFPSYNLANILDNADRTESDIIAELDMLPNEIVFWYGDDEDNYISVRYEIAFGVCGTGLESKVIMLGGKEAVMGTYDGKEAWDFITFGTFEVDKGTYYTFNYSDEEWYSAHGEEVMEILDTIEYE